ncbi:MAG TPA: hypothetical protein VLA24_15180 [Pseudomonadales bacterium]|nr:hypothetical protein [Pseudomonadales bacterium]
MSTIKTTNLQHPSAASPNLVLAADGSVSGGAGLGGLVLVSPTSIANSGGSASASGGEVTFTGVSSVSLNGVFSSAYENYRIVFNGISSSATATGLNMRFRASGTDASSSLYLWGGVYITQGAGPTRNYSGGLAATGEIAAVADYTGDFTADIIQPALAANSSWVSSYLGSGTSSAVYGTISGAHTAATSYDGCTIYPNVGTITGKIRVYGYKNS